MLANAPVTPVLAVKDLDAAIEFYTDKLGLNRIEFPIEGGAMFSAGADTRLFIYPRPDGGEAENTTATFAVEDIEAVVSGLKANGVVFDDVDLGEVKTDENNIIGLGPNRSAWFQDPSGNVLQVVSGPM